jgi:hypothetical protein
MSVSVEGRNLTTAVQHGAITRSYVTEGITYNLDYYYYNK